MLDIITGNQIGQKQTTMEKVWRFRHQCFVEELGWEALRRTDRRERDQFDTQSTIHLVLMEMGEVVGYSRLLPTTKPHLLSHIYPELLGGKRYPTGRHVFEWGRCAADARVPCIGDVATADILMTAVLEFLVHMRVETVIIETNPMLVEMVRKRGYPLQVLCEPMLYCGEMLMAIAAQPSPQLLELHRKTHGLRQSLLSMPSAEQPEHPVINDVPLRRDAESGGALEMSDGFVSTGCVENGYGL
jgi:acyl-homoserine lactone synthase